MRGCMLGVTEQTRVKFEREISLGFAAEKGIWIFLQGEIVLHL